MRPLDPGWRRYAWSIARQGPTELGYAFFRARRRRRNLGDRDLVLSESDQLALSGAFDLDEATLAAHGEVLAGQLAAAERPIRTLQWFNPWFNHAYFGGTYTILRFADHLAREHGVESRFCIYDVGHDEVRALPAKIAAAFPSLAGARVQAAYAPGREPLEHLEDADAAVCTYWTSVYPLLRFNRTSAKFFFLQDWEPSFYPAGSAWALAEQTYRLGIPGLVNTPGLADVYRSYGNPAVSFVPAVDRHRYHPPATRREGGPVRIFFYGRPFSARNAFGLGVAALAAVKERHGDAVDIVSAGADWLPGQYGVADKIRNLGVLSTLDEVAELYRSCDIGLVFMLTAHPSYQPFEFMASGMATVSNDNPQTRWMLRDGENAAVVPPAATPVADAVGRLVVDVELRRRLAAGGSAQVAGVRWEEQLEKLWRAMNGREELTREPETGLGMARPEPLVRPPVPA